MFRWLAFAAFVLLIAFGKQISAGLKSAATFVYARLPSIKVASIKGATAGIFSASIEYWKVLAILFGWWFFLSGVTWQGCELPNIPWPIPGIGGATEFIVLHEATKDDEAFSNIAKTLQDQESTIGKEIIDAGWNLMVLDDDAEDKDDQPLPLLKSLGVHGSIMDAHRELIAFNPPAKLVKRETIPADATPDSVMAMIRARGKHK